MTTQLILLAAGMSQRFLKNHGQHKLLYQLPNSGHTILQSTYVKTAQVFKNDKITIVVNKNLPEIGKFATDFLDSPILEITSNGIGETISQAVEKHQQLESLMILLADLPYIHTTSIQTVKDLLQIHNIVRPCYRHQPGHPVGFHASYYAKLISLKGDNGANSVFKNEDVFLFNTYDKGTIQDIDTLYDIEKGNKECGQ